MTSDEVKKRRALRWVAYYKVMAWLSDHKRTVRWVFRAFSAAFFAGILLFFWFPVAGVLTMFAAASPLILLMLVAGVGLVHDEITAIRDKDET